MRILSQDGTKDIPYDMVIIKMFCHHTRLGEYHIKAGGSIINSDFDNNYLTLAIYSTEEKAKKAMEMLKTAHTRYGCFQFPADDEIEV